MSKGNLEKLLLDVESLNKSTDKLVEENKKSVLKNTMQDAIRNYIKEAVEEEDADSEDEMAYDETDVDAETGEEMDAIGDGEAEDADVPSDEDQPMGGESPIDVSVGMDDEDSFEMGDDEEVMDLTNATEEEVFQALRSLPDDATIEIVKKPSFDVNITQGGMSAEMDSPMGASFDMGNDEDSMDDSEMPMGDMGDSMDDSEMPMGGMDDDDMDDDMDDDDNLDEMLQEALREMEESNEMNEVLGIDEINEGEDAPYDNSVKVNVSKGGKNAPFEAKGKTTVSESKLRKMYNQLLRENKQLKATEIKAAKMLKESMAKMKQIVTMNSKLAYTTRLFTEHSTTKKEKEQVLAKMDTAKTVSETKIIFNMISESLDKRVSKKTTPSIKENIAEAKIAKSTIKEEKTYIDPENQNIMRLMTFKGTY